jgi:alpha-ketoglutarate-dependent taurine dioxygenase
MIGEAFKLLRNRHSVVTLKALTSRKALTSTKTPAGAIVDPQVRHEIINFIGATRFKSAAATPRAAASVAPTLEVLKTEAPSTLRGGKQISGNVQSSQIVDCMPVNKGKQLELQFADQSRYLLHTAWIKDASPANTGKDYYRKSASDVWALSKFRISEAKPSQDGNAISLQYTGTDGSMVTDEVNAKFLHAFAPFVGKTLHTDSPAKVARGTSNLWNELTATRKGWKCDAEVPQFDAKLLEDDLDLQTAFLEAMVTTGVAQINGLGEPEDLERQGAGKPLEDLVFKVIGKFNQHPIRSTRYGVIRKTSQRATQGADYDMQNPLSMHTDHSVYHGTPGFLQFLYQAEGNCRSKVVDGVALAEYFKENYPDQFKLLTTVHITHSSRNNLYTTEGAPRNIHDPTQKGFPFELVHTHPVIELDEQGRVEKVVQSETKRGVSALTYDEYEPFMDAYKHWVKMCEDDRFIRHFDWPEGTVLVTNNWQVMHGRASVPPEMKRTMCFAYVSKVNVENRYRYLKQCQAERDTESIDSLWMTRVPNQVLANMISDLS